MTINFFSDFSTATNAFLSGQVDLTDFPSLPTKCSDCFWTPPQTQLSIYDFDLNHQSDFLGVALQTGRSTTPPTFVLPVTSTSGGCGAGFGRLTVNLQNQERGNVALLDPLNKLTISGVQTVTVFDAGGQQPNGTYVFPCLVQGTYKISSSVYNATAPCSNVMPTSCLTLGGGQSVSASLKVNWNSPSTKQPSQAGAYIARALAHLVDKPSFVASSPLSGAAVYDDEWSSPVQNLPNLFPLSAECIDHPWFSPCNPVSAYNFVSDSIQAGSEWWTQPGVSAGVGTGYSGVEDLRAACDDFVKAGFAVVGGSNSTDCGNVALASRGTSAPASFPHLNNNGRQVVFLIRSHIPRRAFGQIVADSINFLFGTANNGANPGAPPTNVACTVNYGFKSPIPGCGPQIYTFGDISACVFGAGCPWNMYTGGFALDAVPDLLYAYFHSSFASTQCGGRSQTFILNYAFYCDPQFDTDVSAAELAPTSSGAYQFLARAAAIGSLNGMNMPMYTPTSIFAALSGWNTQQQCTGLTCWPSQSSLVPVLGKGWGAGSGYWSLLNMRQVPGYTPVNPSFKPGGGNPDLIRRGFSQDTDNLSPFQATTPWDLEIISLIYDSLLQPNPFTLGTDGEFIDWQTIGHRAVYDPNEVSCNALNGCVTGTTTTTWQLRPDLKFHDGSPVTADDVVYTILAYRDVPSAQFQSNVATVSQAIALDTQTVQVKLQGAGFISVTNLGLVPIIPARVWSPICGPIVNGSIPSGHASRCTNITFDPMTAGIMIGSGPWVCRNITTGAIGGTCSQNFDNTPGTMIVSFGGKITLNRFHDFMRCCPNIPNSGLHKFSFADKNNDGIVNILDVADVASHFGQPDPYWVPCTVVGGSGCNSQAPTDVCISVCNTVDIGVVATVAFYFGTGLTSPFMPAQVKSIDPQVDPFFCPATGC